MAVSVWGYLDEYREERADLLDAVDTVFGSGQLVLGRSVTKFEDAFAEHHQVRHCIGLDNGTNAIALGLRAMGVGEGDEVITVANTAAPTVVAIDTVGAKPVFVDVSPDTYLMDVSQVSRVITERTKCLLPVHLYGQCVDMTALRNVAVRYELPILEDCAQSHGARQYGEIAGSMGNAAAFSFYPTKVLGAYGDGGATITSDPTIAANLRRLRYYGMHERYYVVATPGFNSRLDEVQAEILRRKLARLDGYIARRRAIAQRYAAGLADTGLVLPYVEAGNEHVHYLYVIRHVARDEIIGAMRSYGVNLNISYPWPVHTMTGFAHLGYREGSLPATEELANEVFSLPMYPSLSEREQDKVINALREVLLGLGR
ncbi:DegT/DnrJ/EryC1/StrS family aminotransferase [Sciscionella marina]|uniref:DegT/DnrJ/EryC1/StrS family aminotransferase n=1 Tax=Sciscionella marina TaxID=508770 RepID=UPI000381DE66|nr:DegT/DnrJ/EryC1/StrS family aminotransferase [Sciscionella marina]